MTLLVLVVIFPLFILADFKLKRTADRNPEIEFDYNERSTIFILSFTPFIALFYDEYFWKVILLLIPLYAYFGIFMYISNKKSWCPFRKVDLYLYASSGLITTILAYYIWFHDGLLVSKTTSTISATTASKLVENSPPSVWPYYVFGLLLTSILISTIYEKYSRSDKPGSSSTLLTFAVIIFPLLPLFVQSYWWGMLAGLSSLLVVTPLVSSLLPGSIRGGMSFVLSYIFMMTATLSIILYAILF